MRACPVITPFLALVLAGCGSAPVAPPSVTVPGAAAWAEPGKDGPELVVGIPGPDGRPLALGRARGLRLVTEEDLGFPHILPFASSTRDGQQLVFHCLPAASHRARVQIEASSNGELRVLVVDEVGLENRVREITLDYQFLAEGPVGEAFVPQLPPRPEQALSDASFHLPLAYLRAGSRALAVMPDIEHLGRHRRIPQCLRADPDLRQIRHGLMVPADVGGGEPVAVRGERLEFAHWVVPGGTAAPESTLNTLVDGIWQRLVTPVAQKRAAHAMPDVASVAQAFLARCKESNGSTAASFGWDRQDLAVAHALARLAMGDEVLRRQAARTVRLLLSAPRRSGMLPLRADVEPGRLDAVATGNLLRTQDAAWTGWWLLQLPAWLPEENENVAAATDELGRFLVHNQLDSGAFPTWFDREYLAPQRDPRLERSAESACAALFLAELAATTDKPDVTSACWRALSFLDSELRTTGLATALPSERPLLSKGSCRPVSSQSLGLASLAAARAASASKDSERREAGIALLRRFLLQLACLQQTWERPWQATDRTGAFRRSNLDADWNDHTTVLCALAFLEGYELTGDPTFLQRGAAALTAAMNTEGLTGGASAEAMALVLFVSHRVQARLGQAVFDVPSGRTGALDALWIQHAAVTAGVVDLLPLTTAGPARARICIRGAPPLPEGYRVTGTSRVSVSAAELAAGIELPVRTVPALTFRPPAEVALDQPFEAFAAWSGEWPDSAQAWLEVVSDRGSLRVPLDADHEAHRFQPAEPFVPQGHEGERLRLRLWLQDGDLQLSEPVHGMRTVVIGPMHCIDPGDDDEHTLQRPTAARLELFETGAENCRALPPEEGATWLVPVPPDATRLRLQILLRGHARVDAGDRTLHDDREDADASVRWLAVESTDRRLWQDGTLPLRLQARHGPLQIARIRHLASGRGAIVSGQVRPAEPVPGLRVAVIPVEFDDLPVTATALDLQQACFGDRDYTATPGPQPRRTAGSAAALLRAMSGGDAALRGSVLEPIRVPGLASAHCATEAARQKLAETLRQRLRSSDLLVDLVVAVLGAPAAQWLPGSMTGTPPVVMLPERTADGSFLPSGSLLTALLVAGHGVADLTSPDASAFGRLDLTSCGGGHVPSGLTGSQLQRLGWVDRIELSGGDVEVPALHEDRAFLALVADPLCGRADLLVEDRRSGPGEPGLSGGILLAWDLRQAPPLLFGRGREPCRPHLLRLSPDPASWPTPWHPGGPGDLFLAAVELDGSSSPSLATVEGESLWALSLRPGSNRWQLHIRSLVTQPGPFDAATWTTRTGPGEPAPMPLHLDLGSGGQVTTVAGTLRVKPRSSGSVRGDFPLPLASGPRRLFATLRADGGNGVSEATLYAGAPLLRVPLAAGAVARVEVDLPRGLAPRLGFEVAAGRDGGPAVFLESWRLVPLQPAQTWLLGEADAPAAEPWSDGVVRTIALQLVCSDQAPVELPAAVPAGRCILRLRLGRPYAEAEGEPVRVDLAMRSRDGSQVLPLCELSLPAGPGPVTTALVPLPHRERDEVMFFVLRRSGPAGARAWVQSAQIVRP